jgi:hypothetical protein
LAVQLPLFVLWQPSLAAAAIFPSASARLARAEFPGRSDLKNNGRISDLLGQEGHRPVLISPFGPINPLSYLEAGRKVASIGIVIFIL